MKKPLKQRNGATNSRKKSVLSKEPVKKLSSHSPKKKAASKESAKPLPKQKQSSKEIRFVFETMKPAPEKSETWPSASSLSQEKASSVAILSFRTQKQPGSKRSWISKVLTALAPKRKGL